MGAYASQYPYKQRSHRQLCDHINRDVYFEIQLNGKKIEDACSDSMANHMFENFTGETWAKREEAHFCAGNETYASWKAFTEKRLEITLQGTITLVHKGQVLREAELPMTNQTLRVN